MPAFESKFGQKTDAAVIIHSLPHCASMYWVSIYTEFFLHIKTISIPINEYMSISSNPGFFLSSLMMIHFNFFNDAKDCMPYKICLQLAIYFPVQNKLGLSMCHHDLSTAVGEI